MLILSILLISKCAPVQSPYFFQEHSTASNYPLELFRYHPTQSNYLRYHPTAQFRYPMYVDPNQYYVNVGFRGTARQPSSFNLQNSPFVPDLMTLYNPLHSQTSLNTNSCFHNIPLEVNNNTAKTPTLNNDHLSFNAFTFFHLSETETQALAQSNPQNAAFFKILKNKPDIFREYLFLRDDECEESLKCTLIFIDDLLG
ncbi:hypothetical protein TUBRATIS_29440 [Tubulinosema ratisbonensis]|uniref:Uncharacterized protein n=1 Tax=Tubulinosema ratisbonensis TaxID=291195 RepID=A0A437AHG7_9MICR|nr:hypothetical protein TUBRATIS_29440 [Tubulinosema ratisbonensis]